MNLLTLTPTSMSINQRIKNAFWRISDRGTDILHLQEIKPFEHEVVEFGDERVNAAVKYHNEKWFHTELVARTTNVTVEPQCGYAVRGLRTIVDASIRTEDNLPSPLPILKATFRPRWNLKKAILFDGSMGINYFHLLSDVLHKLYVLEEYTEIDGPVLVGQTVWTKPFFQYLIRETSLSRYDWQQITQPIHVQELWISRPMPYAKKHWLKTKSILIQKNVPLKDSKAIFINRSKATTRHIINFDAIEPILKKLGVSVIDPGSMNVREQAELYNSATHVIGIHGAGMANVVFCNHEKVKVLELCSNNRIGTQYYWLCTALGINWDMMLGGQARNDQSFELNPKEFEARLAQFLAS